MNSRYASREPAEPARRAFRSKVLDTAKEREIAAPASVEAYLAACSADSRAALEQLRMLIKAAAPEATEPISYRIPAFKARGRMLVWYGAVKDHCSFFPGSMRLIEAHKQELAGYATAKGTIHFRPDRPLPAAVVEKIVRARLAEKAAP